MLRPARASASRSLRAPAATCVFVVTASLTAASLARPGLLLALRRSPAILEGELWRLVTALFVERGGSLEITVNLVTLALFGPLTERAWGSRRWLLLYLSSGITGELAGLAWRPIGAGSSVAFCGLLGASATWLFRHRARWPLFSLALLVVVAGAALTGLRNLHGPPILVGVVVAWLLGTPRPEPSAATQQDG
jgi:rhomboid protease GluP